MLSYSDIFNYIYYFKQGGKAVSKRKPRSERRGWETSFKPTLLLRAEGGIRPFFVGHCRGNVASGARSRAISIRQYVINVRFLRRRTVSTALEKVQLFNRTTSPSPLPVPVCLVASKPRFCYKKQKTRKINASISEKIF